MKLSCVLLIVSNADESLLAIKSSHRGCRGKGMDQVWSANLLSLEVRFSRPKAAGWWALGCARGGRALLCFFTLFSGICHRPLQGRGEQKRQTVMGTAKYPFVWILSFFRRYIGMWRKRGAAYK